MLLDKASKFTITQMNFENSQRYVSVSRFEEFLKENKGNREGVKREFDRVHEVLNTSYESK